MEVRIELKCGDVNRVKTGLIPSADRRVSSNHEAESRHDDDFLIA